MGKGVHHVLAFGDTLVKKRTTMTAKQLATETVEFAFKSGELTIDAYKNAYNLFFPRKGRR
ncbi:MAG TPA: hypothetical protein VHL80_18135 [Polyangia bacterium]|nr:hypothetical protein [Polyangia bacterium]